ncbi:hypothetical protein [endosymbiont of Ridgeia piscesae]|jgi:hypothetical protein|uniref:Uncharacterized protein n=1 Tax=endosymbiont of Ridgeia piscesae TaxID=54398 RepID=A0A0T5YZW9_9GAMM|nr:hypothetical protein [endosymbiont of Ridgeia piscesae]KRT56146.1 hypothetical protein Ga0074115_13225 [endosymbiont of Ridgeia piscesae]KRT58339.1 hypothetical protein Ga0076813_13333 [endosymbiont of Ridgeia piscesae]
MPNIHMGMMINGEIANNRYIDGDESSYNGGALPDRWTRLFGTYQADFQPGNQAQLQHHPL